MLDDFNFTSGLVYIVENDGAVFEGTVFLVEGGNEISNIQPCVTVNFVAVLVGFAGNALEVLVRFVILLNELFVLYVAFKVSDLVGRVLLAVSVVHIVLVGSAFLRVYVDLTDLVGLEERSFGQTVSINVEESQL